MLATISITTCDLNLDVALLPSIQISGSSHQVLLHLETP